MNKVIKRKIIERQVAGRYYVSTIDIYQDEFGRKWEDLRPWDSFAKAYESIMADIIAKTKEAIAQATK